MTSPANEHRAERARSDPFEGGLPSMQPPLDNRGTSLDGMLDVDVQMSFIKNFGVWTALNLGMSAEDADLYGESLIVSCMEDSCFDIVVDARKKFDADDVDISDEEILDAMGNALNNASRDAYKSDALEAGKKSRDIAVYLIKLSRSDYEFDGGYDIGVLKTSNYKAGPPKRNFRIDKKAKREKKGVHGEPRYDDILDYERNAIDGQTAEEIGHLCAVAEWAYVEDIELPGGARIVDMENRFEIPTPNGHRGMKLNIAVPLDESPRTYHIIEMQIRHEGFEQEIEAKKTAMKNKLGLTSHSGYEQRQYMSRRFKDPNDETPWGVGVSRYYGDVIKISMQIHDEASQKFGLDGIDFDHFMGVRLEHYHEQLRRASHDDENEMLQNAERNQGEGFLSPDNE